MGCRSLLSGPLMCARSSHYSSLIEKHTQNMGPLWDKESQCDKEVTPPLLAISVYIPDCFYSHLFSALLAGLLLTCIPLSSYTTVIALSSGLALPLSDCKRPFRGQDMIIHLNYLWSDVRWTHTVWKTCHPFTNMIRWLEKPEETATALLQKSCFKFERRSM